MTQDESNLNLLSTFHYVVGGLVAAFSCIFLIHVGLGIAMLAGAFGIKGGPPAFVGVIFIVIGAVVVLMGWTLAVLLFVAASKLKKRKSRTFCIVIAALECFWMPFGTILGVFTLVMLTKDSVKALFDGPAPAPAAPVHDQSSDSINSNVIK
jgi:hypothetical protein